MVVNNLFPADCYPRFVLKFAWPTTHRLADERMLAIIDVFKSSVYRSWTYWRFSLTLNLNIRTYRCATKLLNHSWNSSCIDSKFTTTRVHFISKCWMPWILSSPIRCILQSCSVERICSTVGQREIKRNCRESHSDALRLFIEHLRPQPVEVEHTTQPLFNGENCSVCHMSPAHYKFPLFHVEILIQRFFFFLLFTFVRSSSGPGQTGKMKK